MANPRCKVCLSFNLPGSRVCSQCGSRLTGGARWPWLLGLVASLGLCAGVLWSQRRMLGPPVETPLPAVPVATRPVATAPESHADEDRATPAEAEEPAPPALVRVTPFDADGLALSPAVSCAVADGKIALPMACVRGASSVDVDGVKVLAVQSYQDDVVVLNQPQLHSAVMPLRVDPPREHEELLAFATLASVRGEPVSVVRAAKDSTSGADRLVVSRADLPLGAVLQDRAGRFAGFFLGASTDGRGIVLPASRVAAALGRESYLGLDQLRMYYHESNALSRRELGLTYAKLGQEAKAIDELLAAVHLEPSYREELGPTLINLFRTRAAHLHGERRDGDAQTLLEQARREYPYNGDLCRDLSVVQLSTGDPMGALVSLKLALSLGVEDRQGANDLIEQAVVGAGREARNRRDAGEAIARLEDGANLVSQSGAVRLELGNAYADGGFLEAAIAAYAEAKRLDPTLALQADAGIERLRGLMSTSGGVEIHFAPGSKAIRATMRLNDRVATDVIIDTGASTSVITRKVADRLGLDLRGATEVEVLTAGGRVRAPVGRLRSAAIGNAVVQDLEVVVVDLPDWDGTGGLVGLNFLDRFRTTIDFQGGVLTLSAR